MRAARRRDALCPLRLRGIRDRGPARRRDAGRRARCRLCDRCRRGAGLREPTDADRLLANPNNPTGTLIAGRDRAAPRRAARPTSCSCSTRPMPNIIDDADYGTASRWRATTPTCSSRGPSRRSTGSRPSGSAGAMRPGDDRRDAPHPRAVQRHRSPASAGAIAALADSAWSSRPAHNPSGAPGSRTRSPASAMPACARCRRRRTSCWSSFEDGPVTAEAANEALMEAGYIVRWLPGQGLPQRAAHHDRHRGRDARGRRRACARFVAAQAS